ncbi:MAG: AAA family ATPase [Elusimicrobia bacterium]|nr:AAA family ATPase [Candidatus Obscuribacterium magneticum]
MNKAKFKIWWDEHWLSLILWITVSVGVVLVFGGVYVYIFQLESFQKQSMIAQAPLWIFTTAIGAIIYIWGLRFFMYSGFSKMKSSRMNVEFTTVKFSDVIGLEEAKREAQEVVSLIKDRARVKKIGGKVIKGILMQGPPGCGKTLLAKAIAAEAGLPFLAISGSEFVEVFVGVGASRIRQMMKRARLLMQAYGACIVFIDELEVIGRGRVFNAFGGGEETNSTQNQLLVEMDGFQSGRDNVIFLGATNAPESRLDVALLRPGRFDRKIYVGLPHLNEREEIYKYYLNKISYDPAIAVLKLAQRTVQKSPADIEASVKEAALIATREGRDMVMFKDLVQALERIDLGIVHRLPMSQKAKEATAFHESGHLVVIYNQQFTHDVFKASILHRGSALGHVLPVPKEEQYTLTRDELLADIQVSLAGFVAERIKYGVTSTGVSADFANALAKADAMVWQFGMGSHGLIGNYAVMDERRSLVTLSESLKKQMNDETQTILKQCEKDSEELLRREWNMVEIFAKLLIEKEELNYDEIEEVFAQYGKSRPRAEAPA